MNIRLPYFRIIALLITIVVVGLLLNHYIPIIQATVDNYNQKINEQNQEVEKLLQGLNSVNSSPQVARVLYFCPKF